MVRGREGRWCCLSAGEARGFGVEWAAIRPPSIVPLAEGQFAVIAKDGRGRWRIHTRWFGLASAPENESEARNKVVGEEHKKQIIACDEVAGWGGSWQAVGEHAADVTAFYMRRRRSSCGRRLILMYGSGRQFNINMRRQRV